MILFVFCMEDKKNSEVEKIQKRKISFTDKIRANPWMLASFVLGGFMLLMFIGGFSGGITGNTISQKEIGEQLLNFYDQGGLVGLKLDSVEQVSGLYKVNFEYEGAIVPIYVTKDGKLGGPLNKLNLNNVQEEQEQEPQEVVKSDKPVVELFVMTHCPYGTQSEKGIIPVIRALGDSIDAKIRFVHYFMHEPEETETPRQVCIREEQPDKFLDYLECFLEDGDSNRCIAEVGINENAMNTCVSGKADDYYAEDSALSESYGVRGSPTLVINGQIVSSGRSPSAYADVICSAFNDFPDECSEELSSASPSPGFGYGEGQDTGAQC